MRSSRTLPWRTNLPRWRTHKAAGNQRGVDSRQPRQVSAKEIQNLLHNMGVEP